MPKLLKITMPDEPDEQSVVLDSRRVAWQGDSDKWTSVRGETLSWPELMISHGPLLDITEGVELGELTTELPVPLPGSEELARRRPAVDAPTSAPEESTDDDNQSEWPTGC